MKLMDIEKQQTDANIKIYSNVKIDLIHFSLEFHMEYDYDFVLSIICRAISSSSSILHGYLSFVGRRLRRVTTNIRLNNSKFNYETAQLE